MSPDIHWVPEAIRFAQDPLIGCIIEQLTSDAVTSTNIYPEQRYTSADGSRIALSRKPFNQPNQLWVCDLKSMRVAYIAHGEVLGASYTQNTIFYRDNQGDGRSLKRLDLLELSTHEVMRFDEGDNPMYGAVSPDSRYLIGGPFEAEGDNMRTLKLYDLANKTSEILTTQQDMTNPHMQFDPAGSGMSIVQINRPRHRSVPGLTQANRWPGASLSVVNAHTKKYEPLPAGRPHTNLISGHECWAGTTGEILFTGGQYNVTNTSYVTLNPKHESETHLPAAAIYGVRPGDKQARVIAQGLLYNHLASSDDGKYFIADDHTTGIIHIGSIATGKARPLCHSYTRQGVCQYSHVHPYMTADNAHVIFNSIVTGIAQVYAAKVPEGFLQELD